MLARARADNFSRVSRGHSWHVSTRRNPARSTGVTGTLPPYYWCLSAPENIKKFFARGYTPFSAQRVDGAGRGHIRAQDDPRVIRARAGPPSARGM